MWLLVGIGIALCILGMLLALGMCRVSGRMSRIEEQRERARRWE